MVYPVPVLYVYARSSERAQESSWDFRGVSKRQKFQRAPKILRIRADRHHQRLATLFPGALFRWDVKDMKDIKELNDMTAARHALSWRALSPGHEGHEGHEIFK